MLSLLAQDLISPLIGVGPDNPGHASVSAALNKLNPGMDFGKALSRAHAPALQSQNDWQRVYGDLTIELQRPANPAIEMYLMVR